MESMQVYPLALEPIFKSALWGGYRLRPLLGYPTGGEPIGEAWILSDQGQQLSQITNGNYAGMTLRDLLQQYPQEMTGSPRYSPFPLLLKLIDTQKPLSVQVHPNDTQAQQMEQQPFGKTEAWYILASTPHSKLYVGFCQTTTCEEVRATSHAGTVDRLLHTVCPQVGECYFLPAGTPHAIGADLLLFEVQQSSDITYRLFDWNRVDEKTGQPRPLHIEQSLKCLNYQCGPIQPTPQPLTPQGTEIVNTPYFSVFRREVSGSLRLPETGFSILVGLSGELEVKANGVTTSLTFGKTVYLPAALKEVEVTGSPGGEFLHVRG